MVRTLPSHIVKRLPPVNGDPQPVVAVLPGTSCTMELAERPVPRHWPLMIVSSLREAELLEYWSESIAFSPTRMVLLAPLLLEMTLRLGDALSVPNATEFPLPSKKVLIPKTENGPYAGNPIVQIALRPV